MKLAFIVALLVYVLTMLLALIVAVSQGLRSAPLMNMKQPLIIAIVGSLISLLIAGSHFLPEW